MERRKFIKQAASTAIIGIVIPQSNVTPSKPKNDVLAHYVLFWLKDDLSEQEITDFAQFFEDLKKVPSVKSLHYGRAANTNPRDVVDNTFSYNLLVYFDDMDAINEYETHPIHLAAVDKYSKYWTKVAVHDSFLGF